MGNKLIVLGNGFDLACGLESRYVDFFKTRFSDSLINQLEYSYHYFKEHIFQKNVLFKSIFCSKLYKNTALVERKISNQTSEFEAYEVYDQLHECHLTFWDLVFFFSQFRSNSKNFNEFDWCDVERRMLEFLQTPENLKENPSFIKTGNLGSLLCMHLAYYLPNRDREYHDNEWVEYLIDELRLFEKDFSRYIRNLSNNRLYLEKARDLIQLISRTKFDVMKDKIFSFNYTDPFDEYGLDVVNVHGKAENDSILFGVDQEKIMPNSSAFRFTKTFRQMTETKLAKNYSNSILPDQGEIEEIAFFGHSLSEFDYSYFQTIFDHLNIYNSSVRLVFYYQTYEGRTNQELESDLASKISRLMFDYSPSIDNERKGRNLTHKLLLEKRLLIEHIHNETYRAFSLREQIIKNYGFK